MRLMISSKTHIEVELRIPAHLKRQVDFHNQDATIYVGNMPYFEEELKYLQDVFGGSALTEIMALIEGMYAVYQTHEVGYNSAEDSYGTTIVKQFEIDGETVRVCIEILSSPSEDDDTLITLGWNMRK